MTQANRFLLVAAVYLGTFMAALDISIVSVALPSIQIALHTDLAGLQWVVGAYALCLSAFMLSAGPIGDRYGRKRSWLAGVVIFMAGSVVCAAAPSLLVLVAGCAIQGIAGAFLIPGALSILTQAFPEPAERAHVIGGWSSFSAISLVLGPILGGLLVDHWGWPSIFLINLPLGLVALACGLAGIAESADPDHAALDPAGQVLSMAVLGLVTYGLITAGSAGWTATATWVALAAGLLAFMGFVAVETRAARPLLPLDLFRDPGFAATNVASFILGFAGYSSLFFISLLLQRAQGWSATAAGWGMAPQFVLMAGVSALFGRLAARHGVGRLMMLGYALVGLAMLGMATITEATPYPVLALLLAGLGVGMGLAVPSTGAMIMQSVPRQRSGMASATMNALRQAGMTIGVALLGTVMTLKAVGLLTATLKRAGIADAADVASLALVRHEVAAGLAIDPGRFQAMAGAAVAGGFQMAMLWAGLAGMVAVVLLAAARRRPAGG